MTCILPGHSAPAIGFEATLEMLAACHGRVQHWRGTLLRLLAHLKSNGPGRPAQEAARAVMLCFNTAVLPSAHSAEQLRRGSAPKG